MKTNSAIVDDTLGEHRCLWQICPPEIPKDVPACALELHQTSDGKLHLFQFLVRGSIKRDWWNRIVNATHFTVTNSPRPNVEIELAENICGILKKLNCGDFDEAAETRDCKPRQLAAAAIVEMCRQAFSGE